MVDVDYERIHEEERAEDLLERIDSDRTFTRAEIFPSRRHIWGGVTGVRGAWNYYGEQIPYVPDPGLAFRDSRVRILIWLVFALAMVVVGVTVLGILLLG